MRRTDDFLYFTYNGKHSSEFGVFYENNGEDISFPFSNNFKFEETTPLYQSRTYLLGGQKSAKTFTMNLFAENENWFETEEIFEWLNPGEPGTLIIDFRPNYVYKVVISKMEQPTIIPFIDRNGKVTNIINFSITFSTYDDHVAETKVGFTTKEEWTDGLKVWREPDFNFPIMIASRKGTYDFINWSNNKQYMNIEGRQTINFQVMKTDKDGSAIYYKHTIATNPPNFDVNTEIGAMIVEIEKNGVVKRKLMESQYSSKAGIVNKGPMAIEPGLLFSGSQILDIQGSVIKVRIDQENFKDVGNAPEYVAVLNPASEEDIIYLRDARISSDGLYIEFRSSDKPVYKQNYEIKVAAAARVQVNGPHDITYKYKKGL